MLFSASDPSTFRERTYALWHSIKKNSLELNLFESEASWDDHHHGRNEIISTRIFVLLISLSVIILIVYTAQTVEIQSITVKYPSQATFEELQSNSQYSPTLNCPCQNISISYRSLMSISHRFHQLCLSDFIVENSMWINLVYLESDMYEHPDKDYRCFIIPQFRLLFYLCTLANDTLTDALSIFNSNILVSKRAQSRDTIEAQMKSAFDQFRLSTPRTFVRMLDFIRQMAQGNSLVSSISSNWEVPPLNGSEYYAPIEPKSYGNDNCSCRTNSMCVTSAVIDQWIVAGFLVGCYPLDSLLQSTLESLYDLTCINRLKNMYQSPNITFHPLDATLTSPNATVQSLLDVLMIDQWQSSVSYEYYFATCATVSCTYTNSEKPNLIYIITTIIGLYGGLSVALKIIVPVLVEIVQYLMTYRRQRIETSVAVISSHK